MSCSSVRDFHDFIFSVANCLALTGDSPLDCQCSSSRSESRLIRSVLFIVNPPHLVRGPHLIESVDIRRAPKSTRIPYTGSRPTEIPPKTSIDIEHQGYPSVLVRVPKGAEKCQRIWATNCAHVTPQLNHYYPLPSELRRRTGRLLLRHLVHTQPRAAVPVLE